MPESILSPACFLDRDGTLIHDCAYTCDPEDVRLISGVPEALRALKKAGYKLVLITNQSGLARGYFTYSQLERVNARMQQLLAAEHVTLDGLYYCPHYPEGPCDEYRKVCDCRKPEPGMVFQAAKELHLDVRKSAFFGDKLSDVLCGFRAGCGFNAWLCMNPETVDGEKLTAMNAEIFPDLNMAVHAFLQRSLTIKEF